MSVVCYPRLDLYNFDGRKVSTNFPTCNLQPANPICRRSHSTLITMRGGPNPAFTNRSRTSSRVANIKLSLPSPDPLTILDFRSLILDLWPNLKSDCHLPVL